MKAKDLMIGDYLYWGKDKIVKVQMLRKYGDNFGIDVVYNDSVNLYFCTDNDDIYFYSINDLKPIPLTPEILEKNWFVYDLEDKLFEDIYPRISMLYAQYRLVENYGINYGEMSEIKYVHQLQHALRLCGIDKEIIL